MIKCVLKQSRYGGNFFFEIGAVCASVAFMKIAIAGTVLAVATILIANIPFDDVAQSIVNEFEDKTSSKSTSKSEPNSKVEEKVKDDDPVIFPANPFEFHPVGLTMIVRKGTKNGAIISWMDPMTNIEVFRWDENSNYRNGPHYHIYNNSAIHYYAGELVPEPLASIYFPDK